MPDYSHLMRRSTGKALKPQALVAADYPCVIKSWANGDDNKKKTPYVRLQLGLTGWPDSVAAEDRLMRDKDGKPTDTPIDLSKKQFRIDFFLTEDALHRLDSLIESCGIKVNEGEDVPYEVTVPNLIGAHCLATISRQVSDQTGDFFNRVEKLVGQG